ncbi:putative SANT/Myb domain, Homeobox-like domain superfamily protein [Septoria linicola]|nr:putative SANT/Myb domain, Homeobox-like domain superfamily protein [Septoria linicola]
MSYRGGSNYRGPADRSRSPARFGDRRGSSANVFDARHAGSNVMRNGSDAPRGPRSQFDGPPRGPPSVGQQSGSIARPSLRDAPPLGSGARPFRERDYPERRERSPPPRERSPPRKFNEQREFPLRDIDVRSARRSSRDGPPSAGSTYSDNVPFSSSSYRGGGGFRGRGRGDFEFRGGGRGGRRVGDERGGDLFPARRERSPPSRFGRDLSRDGREPDRRDDRRFERRDDERRPEWADRERERERGEMDRVRREPPPARLESRMSSDIVPNANATYSATAAPPINPERLAIIESSGVDTGLRRPSAATPMPAPTSRREPPPPEQPAYLNGRADAAAQRYGSRGSSPPTQAPPVPAFSFSVAPMSAGTQAAQVPKAIAEVRPTALQDVSPNAESAQATAEERPAPPMHAPTAPKAAPVAPKAHHPSPPPTAPRAPRALEIDAIIPPSNRLHGVRSLENMPPQSRPDTHQSHPTASVPTSPGTTRHAMPNLGHPVSSLPPQAPRFDIAAPTGPKAVRAPMGQASVSPRPPFTSPRSDIGAFQPTALPQRTGTPPPMAPSGPRRQSFSVSPKVAASSVPTAPKAARGVAPMMPRMAQGQGSMPVMNRPTERPPFAPSGPRSQLQWNQWRRAPPTGPSTYGDKLNIAIPAKRDSNGDEKDKQEQSGLDNQFQLTSRHINRDEHERELPESEIKPTSAQEDRMSIDQPAKRKSSLSHSQTTTRASFFGGTLPRSEENIIDTSDEEDDELDEDEDATLLEAKHARRERELRAKLQDLSAAKFRATSPLESIARLGRLSVRDLERVGEQHKRDRMDVDDVGTAAAQTDMPPTTHSSGSEEGPEVATPRAAVDVDVAIKDAEDEEHTVRVPRRHSPEPVSLPYLLKGNEIVSLQESGVFQDTLQEIEDEDAEFEAVLGDEFQFERESKDDAAIAFAEAYLLWRQEYEELEKVREEQEKLERQLSTEPGPVLDIPMMPPMNPILEGRRLHKNSSEYEIERVIRESEETARIEQEKMDRAAKKDQADMEKEARLPDQETEEEFALDSFVNTNRLRDPAKLLRVFSYEPPPDTFTEREQDIFIAAFKESPKKWGEIASLLEGRTYKDCIHHYYANKWDGRFRDNRTKRFKGGRGGKRGGKTTRPSRGTAAMADLNRGEDVTQANDTSTGRPKRAAAPTTFGEKEVEAKSLLANPSPAKKAGPGSKQEGNGEEKPAKKQRRAAGEGKPGRKGKSQLATLAAAAPGQSPHKQQPPQPKEEFMRIGGPSLDDASLLAHLQSGRPHGMQHDGHLIFNQEGMHPHMIPDEGDLGRAPIQSAKQSASSYWSVPEQTDFAKYIAHFGTDFAAIANHMGTKTQTMIKNHYQRQVDGGRSDLAEQADVADQRRARGEDMGPPPTPTPITKRKYDNPSGNTPRALAPQTDPMDIDEPASLARPAMMQASPPQLQTKPRYTGSAHGTPVQSHRAVPSPLPPVSTPAASLTSALPIGRAGLQHPLGSRFGLLAENRPEARPNMQPTSMFRPGPEPTPVPPRSQPPPAHLTRTLSGAPHPEFLRNMEQNLEAERSRALQLQAQNEHEARMEHVQPRQHPGIPHTHGSPLNMHLPVSASAMPSQERRREYEERVGTPSRGGFPAGISSRPNLVNPNPSAGSGPQFGMSAMAALSRPPYNPSSGKLESVRPGSASIPTAAQQPPVSAHTPTPGQAPTPAPEPPKKSNLMSILNSEPEEVKPSKRDSLPSASTTRVASPAPPFSSAATPQPISNMPTPRRETFGQSAAPHTQFHRGPFGQSMSTPGQTPAVLKQETPSTSASAMAQAPKQEWHPRMSQGSQPSPPAPAPLDRDPRDIRSGYPFPPHRAMFSNFNPPSRANPSPPPNMLGHSRTPSLTQGGQPQREQQRSVLGAGPPTTQASLHANAYSRPEQSTPFSQAPPQAANRAHHSHNTSITQTPSILDRYGNQTYMPHRDDEARAYQQQQQRLADQERANAIQREREAYHRAEAEQHELRQRDVYSQRNSQLHHQPLQSFGGGPFGGARQSLGGMSMRELSAREAEAAMQDQQHRERLEHERRRLGEQAPPFGRDREAPVDRYGPRPLDERQAPLFRRQTPQSGGYGFPPPSSNRR